MKIMNKEEFEKQNVFGTGMENSMFAQYFIGNSFLNPLTDPKSCQLLICTAGEGWFQEEGKEAVSLTPGSVITIPAEVKHLQQMAAGSVIHLKTSKMHVQVQK